MEIEIINYIKEGRVHGLSDVEIKQNLLNAGWEAGIVEENFVQVRALDTNPGDFSKVSQAKAPIAETAPLSVTTNTEAPQVTSIMSDQSVMAPKQKSWGKLSAVIIVALLLLGGSAFAYYTYVYNNPTKIWQKFLQSPQGKIYQSDLTFEYSDPNTLSSTSSPIALENLKLKVSGNFYADASNPQKPQSDSNVQYTFGNGSSSITMGFQYILTNNTLYLNAGDNPLVATVLNTVSNGKKIQWLKFDLNNLAQATSSPGAESAQKLKDVFNPNFVTELQKIWTDTSVIKISKFIGREKIGNTQTLHFQNEIDTQAFKNAFSQTLTKIVAAVRKSGAEVKDEDVTTTQFAVNALVDKVKIQKMETWIGASDALLYKVHITSNAPSVISAMEGAMAQGSSGTSSDARRIADMRQMTNALELYYNDTGGYPAGTNGAPQGLVPTYIKVVPTAPNPPTGQCTSYYNNYWYTPMGKKHSVNGKEVYDSYKYTFCLGEAAGTYKAGIAELGPLGIKDAIECPSAQAEQCSNPNGSVLTVTTQDRIKKFINDLKFNGTVTIDASYHDYGKTKPLVAPTDAVDVMDLGKKPALN
jgi:hypothetical protein